MLNPQNEVIIQNHGDKRGFPAGGLSLVQRISRARGSKRFDDVVHRFAGNPGNGNGFSAENQSSVHIYRTGTAGTEHCRVGRLDKTDFIERADFAFHGLLLAIFLNPDKTGKLFQIMSGIRVDNTDKARVNRAGVETSRGIDHTRQFSGIAVFEVFDPFQNLGPGDFHGRGNCRSGCRCGRVLDIAAGPHDIPGQLIQGVTGLIAQNFRRLGQNWIKRGKEQFIGQRNIITINLLLPLAGRIGRLRLSLAIAGKFRISLHPLGCLFAYFVAATPRTLSFFIFL